MPAKVFLGLAGLPEPALTRDISIHGVFVYIEKADPVGSIVKLVVLQAEDEKICRACYRVRVVRVEKNNETTSGFAAVILGREALASMESLTL